MQMINECLSSLLKSHTAKDLLSVPLTEKFRITPETLTESVGYFGEYPMLSMVNDNNLKSIKDFYVNTILLSFKSDKDLTVNKFTYIGYCIMNLGKGTLKLRDCEIYLPNNKVMGMEKLKLRQLKELSKVLIQFDGILRSNDGKNIKEINILPGHMLFTHTLDHV